MHPLHSRGFGSIFFFRGIPFLSIYTVYAFYLRYFSAPSIPSAFLSLFARSLTCSSSLSRERCIIMDSRALPPVILISSERGSALLFSSCARKRDPSKARGSILEVRGSERARAAPRSPSCSFARNFWLSGLYSSFGSHTPRRMRERERMHFFFTITESAHVQPEATGEQHRVSETAQ